jgi:hypothetical protein
VPRTDEDRADEDRALLDAIDLVTARLVAEPRVNFEMLTELEQLRGEVERQLRDHPVAGPEEVRS